MLEQGLEIAKTNWKHNLMPHFLLAVLLCVSAPVVMGVRNLEAPQVARIVDMYLCFIGVVLFIPLFLPDANRDIRDLTASKKLSIMTIRLIRLLQAFIVVVLLLMIFLYGLKQGKCEFPFGRFLYAALADCVAMGGLGLLFFGMTDNVVIAYMMPVIYYLVSMGAGHKYLKMFWLMSLCGSGENVNADDKLYILSAGICMMVAALFIKWKRRA